jgi:hypothetical protein
MNAAVWCKECIDKSHEIQIAAEALREYARSLSMQSAYQNAMRLAELLKEFEILVENEPNS